MRQRVAVMLLLLAALLPAAPAVGEITLPPGFTARTYVTGEGFESGGTGAAAGIPTTTTAAFDGAGALYLARTGTNDFVTLSTWTEWDDVQDATGSDIRRPQATRHAERLVAWSASHFEIVGREPAG